MQLSADQSAAASFLLEQEFAWKPRNEWADNAAKEISTQGITEHRKGQLDRFPEQAKILRTAGYHDQAKILEDHHAAETERLAKEKAAAPPPPAPTPWVSQVTNTTPVPGYVGPLLKSERRKAVLAFIRHPNAKSLVDAHGVNSPGLDAKEAMTRAEAAFEAYHAAQPQKPITAQPQAQATAAAPAGPWIRTKNGVPRLSDPDLVRRGLTSTEAIARKMGLLVGDSKSVERAKQAAAHSAALRSGRTIPADLVDKVAANLEAHGYNGAAASSREQVSRAPVPRDSGSLGIKEAPSKIGDNPERIGQYVPMPENGQPDASRQAAVAAFLSHPETQRHLQNRRDLDSINQETPRLDAEAAYDSWFRPKGIRGSLGIKGPLEPNQPQQATPAAPKPIGPYVPKPGKGEPYIPFRDAMDRFWRHPDAKPLLHAMGANDDSLPRDERMRRGEAAYEKFHGIKSGRSQQAQQSGQADPPPLKISNDDLANAKTRKPPAYEIQDKDIVNPPSRFSALIDAAKKGQLKDHLENGLGNFFDKFERVGNKALRKIGIPAGDDQQFSRPQIQAMEWLLSTEFARTVAKGQKSFDFDADMKPSIPDEEPENGSTKQPRLFGDIPEKHRHEARTLSRLHGGREVRRTSSGGWQVRAPKGGKKSEVNGVFYPGGQFMPIHGLKGDNPKSDTKEMQLPFDAPKEQSPKEPTEDAAKPQYTAKGNEVFDANGVRHGAFRNEEKAKAAADEWNLNGKPGAKSKPVAPPAADPVDMFPSLADDAPEAETAPEPESKPVEAGQESTEAPTETKAESTSDGVIPGMEPEQADETPDEAAERQARAMDPDYEFARQSAVPNAGKDLKGSARHKRNAWKGLDEAEADGTAAELVTRDNLMKAEPHNLMILAEENPLTALAGYFALRSLPAKPGSTSKRARKPDEETAKKDRRQYVEAYRELKGEAESLAKSEQDPQKAIASLTTWTRGKINELRGIEKGRTDYMATSGHGGTDKYNNTANSLVDVLKALATGHGAQKTGVNARLLDFEKLAKQKYGDDLTFDAMTDHAQDVIEGRSMPDSFGFKGTAKKFFSPAEMYVKQPTKRTGGRDVSHLTKNPKLAAAKIKDMFGASGIQWGQSTTDDEREHHAPRIAAALVDLADITGLHPKDIGLGGNLGFAIGARGHGDAAAHYEPHKLAASDDEPGPTINLTRKSGVGALAHEWGHALDHSLGGFKQTFDGEKLSGDYYSEHVSPQRFVKDETSGSYGRPVDHSKEPMWQAMDGVRKAWANSGFSKRLSKVISGMNKDGLLSPKKAEYYHSIREQFARTFERHVQHALKTQGRENTYLSGLTTENLDDSLWPTDAETAAMAPAFENLLSEYRKQKYGDSKPQEFSRDEAMSYFLQQSGEQTGFNTALAFLVESNFARKPVAPAAGQKSLFDDDGESAVATAGEWKPPVATPKPKQRAFGWDESKVSREATAHDNKRPGEFAPKSESKPEKQPKPDPEPKQESAPSPVAEMFPSLAGEESTAGLSTKSAMPVLKAVPAAEPEVSAAGDESFNPEKHGGYQPLLQLAQDIRDGKTSLDQYKAQHAFYRKHSAEFLADLNKRFNATQMKNIAGNFGDFSANRNTKEKNAQSIHQKLMTNAFLLSGGLQIDYMGGESYDSALDKHVGKQTGESLAAYQQKKAESAKEATKQEEAKAAGIEDPKTLEDYRNVLRHYGGYDKMPEAMQAAFDEFAATRRRETAAQSKAKVVGFSGGTAATGATSIVEGHHQKRNEPTYTVTVENHLGDGWSEALSRAKQLGGSYVNGRIAKAYNATAGFQFFNKADAEKFQKSLGGEEVDRSDRLDEKSIARMDNASERLAALAESTKRKAEEKLNAPRQTNTSRRAEMAAGAQSQARSEAAKAETMQRISEGLAEGSLKHLGGIRARTHVDTLDSLLHSAKMNAWRDSGSNSQDSYEEMRERDATPADIAKAKYPYPKIWDHELAEHLTELSQIPGLKNIARDLKKSTEKSPYKKKIGKISINGGEAKTADQLSEIPLARGLIKDKAVRIHVSQDPALLKGRHSVAYTADGGKTWGTTQDIAVSAAVRGEVDGTSKLDLIDPPQHEQVEIKDPETIANIQKAIKVLKRKSNPRLRSVAEALGMHMEDYNRLHGMDITTPMELRAALREYAPLKKRQDKEDPVKAAERSLVGRKIAGFFPTPRPAIDRMLAAADIEPGMSVLEPSAGKGDILDAIREQHPEAKPIGIETVHELRNLIGMKGHEMHEDSDFLQHHGSYDRIVMNAPYENRQDVEHTKHAYKNLKPGGRLVSLMSAGAFGGSSKKDQEFRDWLDEHGAEVEDMPDGSFNGPDAFRKTGVSTRMVVMNKPSHESEQFSRDIRSAYQVFSASVAG